MANNAFDGCEKVEKALWFCDFFMFKRDWVHLQQLKEMQSSRCEAGVPFVNRMYTKGLPFLCKKVYKRVMSWTSGRRLPVWYFFDYPRGGGKVSPRKSVVQSDCQYDVTSLVSDFQRRAKCSSKRRIKISILSRKYCSDFLVTDWSHFWGPVHSKIEDFRHSNRRFMKGCIILYIVRIFSSSELVEPHIIPLKVRLAVALKEEAKWKVFVRDRERWIVSLYRILILYWAYTCNS